MGKAEAEPREADWFSAFFSSLPRAALGYFFYTSFSEGYCPLCMLGFMLKG